MHHPLIHAHRPRPVERPPGFDVGFLGTLTRRSFVAGMPGEFAPFDASTFTPDYPAFDEEYFEWIALLEAVAEAREQFVFIECGAGYGRWCVRAALAARHLNFHCTAVEAEPTHCHWIGEHLADNGIDPADHEIIWAALAPAMKLLTDRVRRVHVGTHSRPIEADLRRMFLKHRWTPLADYPGFATASTPYGEIRFSDGAQTWLNPRVDKQ